MKLATVQKGSSFWESKCGLSQHPVIRWGVQRLDHQDVAQLFCKQFERMLFHGRWHRNSCSDMTKKIRHRKTMGNLMQTAHLRPPAGVCGHPAEDAIEGTNG